MLWKSETLRTILDRWREEFELDIYWDKDGLLNFKYLTSAISSSPTKYSGLTDVLKGFESDPRVYELLNKLEYGYNFHFAKTYWNNNPTYEDVPSQTKWGGTFERFFGYSWVRSASMATDLASRRVIRRKDPITFDQMRFPLKTFSEDLTDTVQITHFEGSGSAGYVDKFMQIRRISYNIDNWVNSMLLEDVSAFTGKSCILGYYNADGAAWELPLLWTGAAGAQRDYCYLCDITTEQFSDGADGKRLFD